jgi:hypothetical protein
MMVGVAQHAQPRTYTPRTSSGFVREAHGTIMCAGGSINARGRESVPSVPPSTDVIRSRLIPIGAFPFFDSNKLVVRRSVFFSLASLTGLSTSVWGPLPPRHIYDYAVQYAYTALPNRIFPFFPSHRLVSLFPSASASRSSCSFSFPQPSAHSAAFMDRKIQPAEISLETILICTWTEPKLIWVCIYESRN